MCVVQHHHFPLAAPKSQWDNHLERVPLFHTPPTVIAFVNFHLFTRAEVLVARVTPCCMFDFYSLTPIQKFATSIESILWRCLVKTLGITLLLALLLVVVAVTLCYVKSLCPAPSREEKGCLNGLYFVLPDVGQVLSLFLSLVGIAVFLSLHTNAVQSIQGVDNVRGLSPISSFSQRRSSGRWKFEFD